ncbi:DUF2397 family protein [Pelomonas sp. KK5]|uniref:DUF2397 family protein n=1 Tax=Pelomonas sp. KK5 TaxID=1855730 RepID=UPI00097CA504|nr:DUF2397 family protein [Pelomonas sp. KK5]
MPSPSDDLRASLFRHVSAEKAALYRSVMEVFAAAKRQYRLQLRPDEVLAEGEWPDGRPRIEELNAALPWRFGAVDYEAALQRPAGSLASLTEDVVGACWDEALSAAMRRQGHALPEESIASTLLADLAG